MANKYFYYVLVHSENNARFITKVDNKTKYAYWNIYAFTTYQAAYEKFDSLIKDECNPDNSWVGDMVFDENGCVQSGYDISTNDLDGRKERQENLYWTVDDLGNYSRYSYIFLERKELLGD